ncbi:methyltransferase [Planctomycetota bacterium]
MKTKKLSDAQLNQFDIEYVIGNRWEMVKRCVEDDFPDGAFSFLDIGGGNGVFADRMLEYYPMATATVLDDSEVLLSKNKRHERKKIIFGSVADMDELLAGSRFDIVFMNWLLHHLVSDSYGETTENVKSALQMSLDLLKDRGRLSVFENMYDGWLFDNLSGHIIFHLTSSRKLAGLMRKLGANTAGVGICVRSKKNWCKMIDESGLRLLRYTDGDGCHPSIPRKIFLHMGHIRVGHFWLAKTRRPGLGVPSALGGVVPPNPSLLWKSRSPFSVGSLSVPFHRLPCIRSNACIVRRNR